MKHQIIEKSRFYNKNKNSHFVHKKFESDAVVCIFKRCIYTKGESWKYIHTFCTVFGSKLFALRTAGCQKWIGIWRSTHKEQERERSLQQFQKSRSARRASALCASSAPLERTITYSRFKTTLLAALFFAPRQTCQLQPRHWFFKTGPSIMDPVAAALSVTQSVGRTGGGRTASCCAYHIKVATQSAIEKAAATDTNRSVKCFYYSIWPGGESFARTLLCKNVRLHNSISRACAFGNREIALRI